MVDCDIKETTEVPAVEVGIPQARGATTGNVGLQREQVATKRTVLCSNALAVAGLNVPGYDDSWFRTPSNRPRKTIGTACADRVLSE